MPAARTSLSASSKEIWRSRAAFETAEARSSSISTEVCIGAPSTPMSRISCTVRRGRREAGLALSVREVRGSARDRGERRGRKHGSQGRFEDGADADAGRNRRSARSGVGCDDGYRASVRRGLGGRRCPRQGVSQTRQEATFRARGDRRARLRCAAAVRGLLGDPMHSREPSALRAVGPRSSCPGAKRPPVSMHPDRLHSRAPIRLGSGERAPTASAITAGSCRSLRSAPAGPGRRRAASGR